MWTTLALVSVLSLPTGQSGKLALTNVRSTYGVLGATKPDNKVLPGDSYVLSFDIDGVKVDETGKVLYSVGMEVLDSEGKVQFKQDPQDKEADASLGGSTLPAYAKINVGSEQPAGKYTLKVSVTDRATQQSTSISQEYEIQPKGFGLVQVNVSSDKEGKIPAPFLSAGESAFVNFTAVGFGRNTTTQQPDLAVSLRIFDEDGKPTLAKPFTGTVNKDIPAKASAIPLQFDVNLNRPGKFSVELVATDKVTGKQVKLQSPLNVMKSK
jgi:hypothetical protein